MLIALGKSSRRSRMSLDGSVHLARRKPLPALSCNSGFWRKFPFADCEESVRYRIRTEDDVRQGQRLMRLAYSY